MTKLFSRELFAERLKSLMEDNNDTIYTLAEHLGLSPSAISKYTNGNMSPKMTAIESMARKYDVNPIWLMGAELAEKRVNFASSMEHASKIKDINLHGIEAWSDNDFLDEYQRVVVKEHFAELTIRYKALVNRVADSAMSFDDRVKTGEISGSAEEFAKGWLSELDRELNDIKTWIDALPRQLGVAAAKKIGSNPAYPNTLAAHKVGDMEVSDDEMRMIMRLIEENRRHKG